MRLNTLFILPVIALALPSSQDQENTHSADATAANSCFPTEGGYCVGRQASPRSAYGAIIKACSQVPSCTPGGPRPGPVRGKTPGYTATLDLGTQCGGVQGWDGNACVKLFIDQIDGRCQNQYPNDRMFELGYVRSTCDDTFISLNFGG